MIKNSLNTMQPEPLKFPGIYRGVIEDNHTDPLKAGRVKIRVFGLHTDNKEDIPTDHLPWAVPALSLFEGSISGFGAFTVPLQGSHVFVFFEGGNPMKPVYFATAPGVPNSVPDTDKGFNDPDGGYPNIG